MRYEVRKSVVYVVGRIWWPMGPLFSMEYTLRHYDVENMRNDDGQISREEVARWLDCNAGDFSAIVDFSASIEDGETTLDFEWATEDGEMVHCDCCAECV